MLLTTSDWLLVVILLVGMILLNKERIREDFLSDNTAIKKGRSPGANSQHS